MLKNEARKLFLSKRISITSEAYNHINNKILEGIESLKPQLEGKNIHIFFFISVRNYKNSFHSLFNYNNYKYLS